MSDKVPEFPSEERLGERATKHATGLASVAGDVVFPGLGYAMQLVFGKVIGDPLAKRQQQWFEAVGLGIRELQDRFEGFDPASLADNEDFATAVYETTQAAMKTRLDEKREALRNVVLNVAIGQTLDDLLQGRFMSLLDDFSAAHLLVLRVVDAPQSFPRVVEAARSVYMGSASSVMAAEFTNAGLSDATIEIVLRDLEREQMVHGGLKSMGTKDSLLNSRSTEVGKAFLKFISSPI